MDKIGIETKVLAYKIFTKLSQNVYLISTYILTYRYARFVCKLWKALWCYCVLFFGYFHAQFTSIRVWIIVSSSNFHRYTICLINVPILVCQHDKCNCRLRKGRFICVFFGNFHKLQNVWNVIASSNFYKLCVKTQI